jgi:FAD:protein FMN transferase
MHGESNMDAHTRSFPAMGSICEVTIVGTDHGRLAELARRRINELEARWSRFLPTSEVARLNTSDGRPQIVSMDTLLLIDHAVAAWRMTGGRFDPTVGDIMARTGYDRPFVELQTASRTAVPLLPAGSAAVPGAPGCESIAIDHASRTIALPLQVAFDPGGIGKGLAADLVVDTLLDAGALGACVNVGGDLRVAGNAPDGDEAWLVGVANPFDSADLITVVALRDHGMSTSNRLLRRWQQGTMLRNHIVDPRSGASAQGPVAATVIARTAWWAEILTKIAMLDGERHPDRTHRGLQRLGGEALFIDAERTVTATSRFNSFDALVPTE